MNNDTNKLDIELDFSSFETILTKKQKEELRKQISEKSREIVNQFIKDNLKRKKIYIPLDIFHNSDLSINEILIKYLKDELKLSLKTISKKLNKKYSTVWNTYNNAIKKYQPTKLSFKSEIKIPLSIFTDHKLGSLESLIVYLKEECNMKNSTIANLLFKSRKTIWSSYNKAKQKYNG